MLAILISVIGAYFLIRLRGFFLLHPVRTARQILRAFSEREGHPVRTLMLALAGTLGVGNITGVATALLLGGAGASFWMLVSAVFASVLKYAESTLTIGTRAEGGIIGVLEGTGKCGKYFARLYAFFCFFTALFMGSAVQSRAAVETGYEMLGIPAVLLTLVFALFVFLLCRRGIGKIERYVSVIIPTASLVYVALCAVVLFRGAERIPTALSLIFCDAFSPDSAVGGIVGFLLSEKISRGYKGGLLSNEAGAGTSTLAHARNTEQSPTGEGLLGILEVYFDTVFLCFLTALVILVGTNDPYGYSSGMSLLCHVFESNVGAPSRFALFFSIFAFALASSVCWCYYGEYSFSYLTGRQGGKTFLLLYVTAALVGGLCDGGLLILLCDTTLLPLAMLTSYALIKNADRVVALSATVIKRECGKAPFRRRAPFGNRPPSSRE